jgi:hypothetical protein
MFLSSLAVAVLCTSRQRMMPFHLQYGTAQKQGRGPKMEGLTTDKVAHPLPVWLDAKPRAPRKVLQVVWDETIPLGLFCPDLSPRKTLEENLITDERTSKDKTISHSAMFSQEAEGRDSRKIMNEGKWYGSTNAYHDSVPLHPRSTHYTASKYRAWQGRRRAAGCDTSIHSRRDGLQCDAVLATGQDTAEPSTPPSPRPKRRDVTSSSPRIAIKRPSLSIRALPRESVLLLDMDMEDASSPSGNADPRP